MFLEKCMKNLTRQSWHEKCQICNSEHNQHNLSGLFVFVYANSARVFSANKIDVIARVDIDFLVRNIGDTYREAFVSAKASADAFFSSRHPHEREGKDAMMTAPSQWRWSIIDKTMMMACAVVATGTIRWNRECVFVPFVAHSGTQLHPKATSSTHVSGLILDSAASSYYHWWVFFITMSVCVFFVTFARLAHSCGSWRRWLREMMNETDEPV